MRLVALNADRAIAETLGVRREISLALLDGPRPEPGEFVLVHVGYAIARVEAEAAEAAWLAWQAMNTQGGEHA